MIYNIQNSTEDYNIPTLIDDTIQILRFYPSEEVNYFASGGWDSKLRLFELKYDKINTSDIKMSSSLINICQHTSPILSLSWQGSSGILYTGCADGSINYVDLNKNIFSKIDSHDYGCREVIFFEKYRILGTGGWDGILKFYDPRSHTLISSFKFYNKINTMSNKKNLLVLGLSENVISYFNLDKFQKTSFEPELIYSSHIKSQIKKICVLNDAKGYVEGSIEGRFAIKYLDLNSKYNFSVENNGIKNEKDFTFKCHRVTKDRITNIYSVNDISVDPIYGCICTVGGDGRYSIWDLDKKNRVYEKKNYKDKTPLTACDYNKKGNLLIYASGYDWSKGAKYAHLYPRPEIHVHYLPPNHRK